MNPLQIFSVFKGGQFIWKVLRNYRVLSDAIKAISITLKDMHDAGRSMPEPNETQILLNAISNILKTEVIDVPGVDEYQLALGVDKVSETYSFSIQDAKNKKFHQIKLKKEKSK